MFENVVVGDEDGFGSTRAVRRASEVARASGGTLHIVAALGAPLPPDAGNTWEAPSRAGDPARDARSVQRMRHLLRDLTTDSHLRVAIHPIPAEPADAISRVAVQEDADLIVVQAGGVGATRKLSATTKTLLDRVSCAVLVV